MQIIQHMVSDWFKHLSGRDPNHVNGTVSSKKEISCETNQRITLRTALIAYSSRYTDRQSLLTAQLC